MLRKQVTRDAMTGLHNYQHFYKLLHQEIYRSDRYQSSLALIIADIDNFKGINDTYGHLAGDEVIKTLAAYLNDSLRASDPVARYGGDEFATIDHVVPVPCFRRRQRRRVYLTTCRGPTSAPYMLPSRSTANHMVSML